MTSVLFLAIGVAVAASLMGSVAIHFSAQTDGMSLQEKNCQDIANQGYAIHARYPDSSPENLPNSDYKRLMDLDEQWITQCVNVLSPESIFKIADNAQRDFPHDE